MDFVLFDLGGVLCDVEPDRAQTLWRQARPGEGDIVQLMDASGAKPGGDVGRYGPRGMAEVLSRHIEAEVSEALLRQVWGAMVRWRPFVKAMIARLKVPYGVLSTIDPIHSAELGPLRGAEPLVYSWQIEVAKPEKEAFLKALDLSPVSASSILYLDDREDNVAQAESCGMHARRVTSGVEVLHALDSLLCSA